MNFRAVLLDWRGTLALTLSEPQWIQEGLRRLGRDASDEAVRSILDKLIGAPSWRQLTTPDIDSDADRHRNAHFQVFRDAEIDGDLAHELYAVESDTSCNPLALDVGPVLHAIKSAGVRVAFLSDIHFDIRPAFERAGLLSLIDLFVLSFVHGVQKPQPEMFRLALDGLGLPPGQVLMVGDRAAFEGALSP
jgi:FMN phosphatase YigB (HAD superfamily)